MPDWTAATGVVGALVGVRLNALVDESTFALLLGAFVSVTGALVFYRTRYGTVGGDSDATTARGTLGVAVIGTFVGVVAGWKVAQSVDAERLTRVLAALLLLLGPYIAFR